MTDGSLTALILAVVMGAGWVFEAWVSDRKTERAVANLEALLDASEAERLRWEARARRLNVEVARERQRERGAR